MSTRRVKTIEKKEGVGVAEKIYYDVKYVRCPINLLSELLTVNYICPSFLTIHCRQVSRSVTPTAWPELKDLFYFFFPPLNTVFLLICK